MIPVPKNVINKVDKLIYDFTTKGLGKMDRKVLTGPFSSGGCNLPSFSMKVKALHFMWMRRIVSKKEACWKNYPMYLFEPAAECSILRDVLLKKCSAFWEICSDNA